MAVCTPVEEPKTAHLHGQSLEIEVTRSVRF